MPETSGAPRHLPVLLSTAPSAGSYEVIVGAGVLECSAELITRRCPAHRYAIITDEHVAGLYAPRLQRMLEAAGRRAEVFAFPPGEEHKTRGTWMEVSDAMLTAGIGRDGAVVALGGGVVGDLGGFVAATYMRGIPVVQVPTSLLAMIDASVGGKTGVDTGAGKNLIGAFHQPKAVLVDPEVLYTLPPEHLRAGLAEAVKHGAIADAAYLSWIAESAERILACDAAALGELIIRSVEIKAGVVARDEREAGPRKALNFGHTIGHAVEAASGYRLLHGEAVAIGMAAEARIGEAAGVTEPGTAESLRGALARICLPTEVPGGMDVDDLVTRTRTDKKTRADRVEYALIERLGAAGREWGYAVEDEVVRECVSA